MTAERGLLHHLCCFSFFRDSTILPQLRFMKATNSTMPRIVWRLGAGYRRPRAQAIGSVRVSLCVSVSLLCPTCTSKSVISHDMPTKEVSKLKERLCEVPRVACPRGHFNSWCEPPSAVQMATVPTSLFTLMPVELARRIDALVNAYDMREWELPSGDVITVNNR